MIVRESLDFERGGNDPLKTMNIGMTYVEKILVTVKINKDGEIVKNLEGKHLLMIMKSLNISYKFEGYTDQKVPLLTFWGGKENMKKFLRLAFMVQDYEMHNWIKESLDFERKQNPLDSLGIGVKDKIRQGILGLLKASREVNGVTRISTINLLHSRDELWLEISDYGSNNFEDAFYSFLSPEYFKDDIYIKAKPKKFAQSFKNDWKVFIKDEYKPFFQDCFDSGGYIVE